MKFYVSIIQFQIFQELKKYTTYFKLYYVLIVIIIFVKFKKNFSDN